MIRRTFGFVAAGLLLAAGARPASASHFIYQCGQVCESDCDDAGSAPPGTCVEAESGKCILTAGGITCSDTTAAVTLKDGMDLDMEGQSITCQSGVNCGNGVVMTDNGSKVVNGGATESAITGKFLYGVDCQGTGSSEVTGIRIVNSLVGVHNCKTVKNNVIVGLGRTYLTVNWGIQTDGVTAGSDSITSNYIADKSRGISITGDDGVNVTGNVFYTSGYMACGVEIASSGSTAKLIGNTFLGVGNAGFGSTRKVICVPATPPADATYDGNVCDPDHPDCAACTSAGRCYPVVAPYAP